MRLKAVKAGDREPGLARFKTLLNKTVTNGLLDSNPMSNKPFSIHSFYNRVFNKKLAAAGIHEVVWQSFRHTCASRMATGSVPILVINERMRHRSIKMTENYMHLARRQVLDATEAFGQ